MWSFHVFSRCAALPALLGSPARRLSEPRTVGVSAAASLHGRELVSDSSSVPRPPSEEAGRSELLICLSGLSGDQPWS